MSKAGEGGCPSSRQKRSHSLAHPQLFVLSGPRWISWCLPALVRLIVFPHLLIQMLISAGNTPIDTPKSNVLPFIWSSLHPVKLTYKAITSWILYWSALNCFCLFVFCFLLLFGLWKVNLSQCLFLLAVKTSTHLASVKSLRHLFTPFSSPDFFSFPCSLSYTLKEKSSDVLPAFHPLKAQGLLLSPSLTRPSLRKAARTWISKIVPRKDFDWSVHAVFPWCAGDRWGKDCIESSRLCSVSAAALKSTE